MSQVPPPPPPPPGWGPPGPPPSPPASGSNRSVLVLVLVSLLVVGGGAVVLLNRGGDESSQDDTTSSTTTTTLAGDPGGMAPTGGASPEQAVQGYIDAVVDADCAAMVAHLTENMLSGQDRARAVDSCESTSENQPEMASVMSSLALRATDEEDGVARIEGHADFEGNPLLIVFTLVQEGDTWLVDDIA
jgi:hypothetical protein